MNIMDGMDAARFKSGNPNGEASKEKAGKDRKQMAKPVLRNLNNK